MNQGIATQRWTEKSPLIQRRAVVGALRVGRHRLPVADAPFEQQNGDGPGHHQARLQIAVRPVPAARREPDRVASSGNGAATKNAIARSMKTSARVPRKPVIGR